MSYRFGTSWVIRIGIFIKNKNWTYPNPQKYEFIFLTDHHKQVIFAFSQRPLRILFRPAVFTIFCRWRWLTLFIYWWSRIAKSFLMILEKKEAVKKMIYTLQYIVSALVLHLIEISRYHLNSPCDMSSETRYSEKFLRRTTTNHKYVPPT